MLLIANESCAHGLATSNQDTPAEDLPRDPHKDSTTVGADNLSTIGLLRNDK